MFRAPTTETLLWHPHQQLPPFLRLNWDPAIERRAVAKKRVLAELAEIVEMRLKQLEAAALEKGYRYSGKSKGGYRKDPTHTVWLVRRQVLGESYATIAKASGSTPAAVRKAVSELAKAIELPLR